MRSSLVRGSLRSRCAGPAHIGSWSGRPERATTLLEHAIHRQDGLMSRHLMLLRAPVALVTAFSLVVTIATSVEAQRQQRPGQPIGAPDPRTANTQKPPIHAR